MDSISGPCGVLVGGDLATWVGAVGTWAAALATAGAFWVAAIGYTGNLKENRKAQARLLSAWTQGPAEVVPAGNNYTRERTTLLDLRRSSRQEVIDTDSRRQVVTTHETNLVSWRLENASDEAFTDLRCKLTDDQGEEVASLGTYPSLPPHHQIAGQAAVPTPLVTQAGATTWQFRVEVEFTDAIGRRWQRATGSPLVKAASPTA